MGLRAFLLALVFAPLLLVVLAATLLVTPQGIRPGVVTRMVSNYPVRIELAASPAPATPRDLELIYREQARLAALAAEGDSAPALALPVDADATQAPAGAVADAVRMLDLPPVSEDVRAPVNPINLPAVGSGDVMSVDFDLAGGPRSAGSLRTTRPVLINGQVAGEVEMRIDNASSVYVSRSGVLALLPSPTAEARALTGDYILLSDLREAGVNLRYDPTADRMILRP